MTNHDMTRVYSHDAYLDSCWVDSVRHRCALARITLVFLFSCIFGACSSTPLPPKPPVRGGTIHQQKTLGPILGPLTKGKVLDRLKDYPICGAQTGEQKKTLRVFITPLKDEVISALKAPSQGDAKPAVAHSDLYIASFECFFLGVQGIYEFALITPKDGRVYPVAFQGAEPVRQQIQGAERTSPVAVNQGRAEVCGVPQLKPKSVGVQVTCKGDASGGCGAYARYQIARDEQGEVDLTRPHFKLIEARFNSCGQPPLSDPQSWSDVTP